MKELQDAGKIRYIGLSECTPDELDRAAKVVRIDAIQMEYSTWETAIETSGMLATMKKHNVSLVAYSPIGRGMLTGTIKSPDDFAADDFRRHDPRYQADNFQLNMRLVERIKELAEQKSKDIGKPVTAASFCLAWVLYQHDNVFVIPGTTNSDRLKENLSAGNLVQHFTREDDEALRAIIKQIGTSGPRYGEYFTKAFNMQL